MKCFVVVSALLSAVAAEADPSLLYLGHGGLAYSAGLHAAPLAHAPAAYAAPAYAAPAHAPLAVAPAPAPAPEVVSTQYHKQDELKNYEYGYSNINSAKKEQGNAYGGVTGSYSYVDGHGLQQRVDYVADALGFRASGTNVPVNGAHLGAIGSPYYGRYAAGIYGAPLLGHRLHKREAEGAIYGAPAHGYANLAGYGNYGYAAAAPAYGYAGYAAGYTPAATYAAPAAYGYAAHGYAAAAPVAAGYGAHGYAAAAPVAAGYAAVPAVAAAPVSAAAHGYSAPTPVGAASYAGPAAPAAREALLTRVQLNPGHAVSYRVD